MSAEKETKEVSEGTKLEMKGEEQNNECNGCCLS